MQGFRDLLFQNYHIQYIIASNEYAAFSESTNFREILLVASKIKEIDEPTSNLKLNTHIVSLNRRPENITEAKEFASKITKNSMTTTERKKIFEDELMTIQSFDRTDVYEKLDNLFAIISLSDKETARDWIKFLEKVGTKLIKTKNYFEKHDIETFIPPWGNKFNLTNTFSFVCQEFRAIKKTDEWIIDNIDKNNILAENRFTHIHIKIPLSSCMSVLRRPARTTKLDISDELDCLIIRKFEEIKKFLPNQKDQDKRLKNVNKFQKTVKLGNLILSRKLDVSAPGTCIRAFISKTLTIGFDTWVLTGMKDDDAKILSLWYNSSLGWLQLLMNRTETRGAWMRLNDEQIQDAMILNLDKINNQQRKQLLDTFECIREKEFSSILEQLQNKDENRMKIDETIMKILGFNDKESKSLTDRFQGSLKSEILSLKAMMQAAPA